MAVRPKVWDDVETLAQLIRLNDEGLSAGLIADGLGNGISRNAVIGKLMRMGIPLKNAGSHTPSRKPATGALYGRSKPTPPPMPKLSDAPVAPLKIDMMALTDKTCRFPYGDGPMTFCGHPVWPGKVYCGEHCRLSYPPQKAAHGAGNGSGVRADRQFRT